MDDPNDPHRHAEILHDGTALEHARLAVVLLHGRGGSAPDMLALGRGFGITDLALIAPQAEEHTWYPRTFLAPLPENEPWLASALALLGRLVTDLERRGFGADRVALVGFSQGACLGLEFLARQPRPYALVAALSGGLIGPPGMPRRYPGSLAGARVFLGCSDRDAHIPLDRVRESATVLRQMGADVDERIYPGLGHTINADELAAITASLRAPERLVEGGTRERV